MKFEITANAVMRRKHQQHTICGTFGNQQDSDSGKMFNSLAARNFFAWKSIKTSNEKKKNSTTTACS